MSLVTKNVNHLHHVNDYTLVHTDKVATLSIREILYYPKAVPGVREHSAPELEVKGTIRGM